jgi:hypothetical protein
MVTIRQADPPALGVVLRSHEHWPVGRPDAGRGMPDDLVEEPRRGDDREHPWRPGQRGLQRLGIDQPERPVDRLTGDTVRVIKDLSGVQRHPQPDTLLLPVHAVVRGQLRDQRGRQQLHEQALRDLGRQEDEDAVTPILEIISRPGNFSPPERLAHRPVQPLAYHRLVAVGATVIPEALHVEDDDRPVNGSSLTHFAHLRQISGRHDARTAYRRSQETPSPQPPLASRETRLASQPD